MVVVALTAQNKRNVTDHAGKCRNFMVRDLKDRAAPDWQLRSIGREESLSACKEGLPPALQDVDVLITAGAGPGLKRRLQASGIELFVTDMLVPQHALAQWRELDAQRRAEGDAWTPPNVLPVFRINEPCNRSGTGTPTPAHRCVCGGHDHPTQEEQ